MSITLTISTQLGPVPGQGKGNAIPVESLTFLQPNSGKEVHDVVITVKDGAWTPGLMQAALDGTWVTGSLDRVGAFSAKFTNAHIVQFHVGGDGYVSFNISGKFEFIRGAEGVGSAAATAAAAEGLRYLKKQTQ